MSWSNLAVVDGDQLVVTEPSAYGFEPDCPFTVKVPDGYEVVSETADPGSTDDESVTWAAGTSLDGFEFVAESDDGDKTSDDGAGFGVGAAVLGLLTAALGAGRHR